MNATFTFTLRNCESNDTSNVATGDFLDVGVSVACRGFAGQTQFSVSRRDLDSFVADLSAVRQAQRDSAQLLGGWDDAEERLRLRITPAGRSGHFMARVRIANTGPRSDQWHRAETEFVCRPEDLSGFVTDLRQLVGGRSPGDAALSGDPDAIA